MTGSLMAHVYVLGRENIQEPNEIIWKLCVIQIVGNIQLPFS